MHSAEGRLGEYATHLHCGTGLAQGDCGANHPPRLDPVLWLLCRPRASSVSTQKEEYYGSNLQQRMEAAQAQLQRSPGSSGSSATRLATVEPSSFKYAAQAASTQGQHGMQAVMDLAPLP